MLIAIAVRRGDLAVFEVEGRDGGEIWREESGLRHHFGGVPATAVVGEEAGRVEDAMYVRCQVNAQQARSVGAVICAVGVRGAL
jgi:hypothetical protein